MRTTDSKSHDIIRIICECLLTTVVVGMVIGIVRSVILLMLKNA